MLGRRWLQAIALISFSAQGAIAQPMPDANFLPDVNKEQLVLAGLALQAAQSHDWHALDSAVQKLPKDFPLNPYYGYHRLLARLDNAPSADVLAWLRQHDNLPLATDLRGEAMNAYGKQKNWSALRAVSQGVPQATSLRCYYYQSLLEEDAANALRGGKNIWLSGQSRPKNCDALFDTLRKRDALTDDLVWQRMLLAFRAGNHSLMRYLRSSIKDKKISQQADQLLRLYRLPRETRLLMPAKHNVQLVLAGLHRLADEDPVYARQLIPIMSKRYQLNQADADAMQARVAWFSTIRAVEGNQDWLEQYLDGNTSLRLLEQRARQTIINQDWEQLIGWIERLPQSERNSAHWRYWRARALAEQQLPDSQMYMQLAATDRNFWGFLAAQRLGIPYALNDQPAPSTESPLPEQHHRALTRIQWLLALDEATHARAEWLHLLRQSEAPQLITLANIAEKNQWHHFSVETALYSGQRNILSWRFPAAHQKQFEQAGEDTGVDPWLLMAVSRRESAFNPHARSHVGATGLMQLMPATARSVAKQLNTAQPNISSLQQPKINLQLGSHYLAKLLHRYSGNRILALAAYNAGPHRIDRWLADTSMPFDVFIESIPFYETREYVQAVLAYRVILSRHDEKDQLADLMLPSEKSALYSPLMLASKDL